MVFKMTNHLIKSGFTLICLIACTFQIVSIITMYLKYPMISAVIRTPMRRLYVPGITVCNSNRIKRSKLAQIDKLSDFNWSQFDESSNTERLKHQRLIDKILRKMMKEMTVSEFMAFGHTVEDFLDINYTRCASDKLNPQNPCRELLNVVTTVNDEGNCFTLFHKSKSADLKQLAIPPGFAQVPIRRGNDSVSTEISEDSIHPNEVIRLKVDFQRAEYMTLNEPVMGQIVLHDDNEVPIVRERSFIIEPGHYYEFYLRKELSHLLPKPYETDCKVYTLKETEDYNPFLHNPLSKSDCKIGCMAKYTMDLCECWPPEVPFIKGSLERAEENQMKWCDWNQTLQQFNKDLKSTIIVLDDNQTTFDYCFADYETECDVNCNINCYIKSYKINKDVRIWPSKQRIEYSENREHLVRMSNCCAIISIRYWDPFSSVNEFQPKLQDTEFVSYVGGLLSMWIGFSFLSFYDLMAEVFKYIYRQTVVSPNCIITKRKGKMFHKLSKLDLWNNVPKVTKDLNARKQYF